MFVKISVQTADVFEMLDIWRTSCILVHMLWRRLKEKVAKKKQRKNCVSPITINITNCNVVSRIISHLYTPLATTMMKGKDMSPPMPNQRSEVLSVSRSTGFELGGWSSLKGSNFKVTISEPGAVSSGSWVESPSSSSSSGFT